MQSQNVVRIFLFVIFFSIGAATLGTAVLADRVIRYYQIRHLLAEAEESLERLESLNTEYDELLVQLESDPNLVRRIAPITLGTEPNDPNTAYPRARARELAVARKALLAQAAEEPELPPVPAWLERCSEPRRRVALFVAGAGLVLISLVCFTSSATSQKQHARRRA